MKAYRALLLLFLPVLIAGCASTHYPKVGMTVEDVLVSQKYLNSNSFLIVCKGFPREDLTGQPRIESSKTAAVFNAQLLAADLFDDTVSPQKDGLVKKFVMKNDYAVVHYVITKSGLRGRQRPGVTLE